MESMHAMEYEQANQGSKVVVLSVAIYPCIIGVIGFLDVGALCEDVL